MNLEYKYRNFMDWLKRHPITILVITFDPINDNKYHNYKCSMDAVRFQSERGHWRKCLFFAAKATPT